MFSEKAEAIVIDGISPYALGAIVDFLQRRYLLQIGGEIAPFQGLEPPLEHLLDILESAAYLELTDLVDETSEAVAKNFSSLVSLDHMPSTLISTIISKLSIRDTVLAAKLFSNTVCFDSHPSWIEKYSMIPWNQGSSLNHLRQTFFISTVESMAKYCMARCLEFYLTETLMQNMHATLKKDILNVIALKGYMISALSIHVPASSNALTIPSWGNIFKSFPNLQTINLYCHERRDTLVDILIAISEHCLFVDQVNAKFLVRDFDHQSIQIIYPLLLSSEAISNIASQSVRPPQHQLGGHLQVSSKKKKKTREKIYQKDLIKISIECVTSSIGSRFHLDDLIQLNGQGVVTYITSLNLSNLNIGSHISSLAKCFQESAASPSHINVSNCNLSARDLVTLLESLIIWQPNETASRQSPCTQIQSLNLAQNVKQNDCDITECAKILGSLMSSLMFKKLKVFNFSSNNPSLIGISALFEGMQQCKELMQFEIANTANLHTQINKLAQLWNGNDAPLLSHINISDCQLLPRHLESLFSNTDMNRITHLDISKNTLDSSLIECFSNWLRRSVLKSFVFAGNMASTITDEQWICLLDSASKTETLNYVDFSAHGIKDYFCESLSDHWNQGRLFHVKTWILSFNCITKAGFSLDNSSTKRILPTSAIFVNLAGNGIAPTEPKAEYTGYIFQFNPPGEHKV